MILILFLCW